MYTQMLLPYISFLKFKKGLLLTEKLIKPQRQVNQCVAVQQKKVVVSCYLSINVGKLARQWAYEV